MDRSEISEKLKEFLETECKLPVPAANAALAVDSFNMMLIITFASEALHVKLSMDSLNFNATMSLDSLTDLIFEVGDS